MSDELICIVLLGALCVYQDCRFWKFKQAVFDHLSEIWTFQHMVVDTLDKISNRIKNEV